MFLISICIIWTFDILEKVSVFLHRYRKNLAQWNFTPKSIRFSRAVCTHQRGSAGIFDASRVSSLFPSRVCQVNSRRRLKLAKEARVMAPTAADEDYRSSKGRLAKFCIRKNIYVLRDRITHTYPVPSSISKIFKRCLEQVIWVLLQKGSKTNQKYFNMCSLADPWNCIFKSSLAHIFTNFPRHKL